MPFPIYLLYFRRTEGVRSVKGGRRGKAEKTFGISTEIYSDRISDLHEFYFRPRAVG